VAGLDPDMNMLLNAGDLLAKLPEPFAAVIDPAALREMWIVPPTTENSGGETKAVSGIAFDEPLALSIPGLDAVELVIGAAGDATIFEFEIAIRPTVRVTIKDVALALRLHGDYFKPARLNATSGKYERDPDASSVEIALGAISLGIDADAGFEVSTSGGVALPPTMIGDSGVVIEASGLELFLSDAAAPPGKPAGTRGIFIASAAVHLPESLGRASDLTMMNAFIGNGGFSGTLTTTLSPAVEEDFGGVAVTLENVSLKFAQNALIESSLTGTLVVPYFDKRVSVQLLVGIDGHLGLVVTGVAPGQGSYDAATGILSLKTGPLSFELDRLVIELVDGEAIFRGSGKITPDAVAGVTFPSFVVKELSIDSKGRLTLAGGWIDIPTHITLSLYGFTLEITKLAIGTREDGWRWFGLSGGLKLVDGLQAGASVEGLRVSWDGASAPELSLEGVGIELKMPGVLSVKGAVSLKEQQFRGAVEVVLEAIDFVVGGQFVAGTLPTGKKFFGIFVHAELPAGLPLGATGLGIYGMAGLFANNMVPDKRAEEGWYLNLDGSDGWYLRQEPPSITSGVEDLAKWRGEAGGMGFGAGISLGTFADNGYTFNGRLLVVLAFPGPIIMIEGKANLFKKRSALSEDANFRALVVIEPAKSFLMALDAKYKFGSGAELLEIGGSAEAFFDFVDADRWHLWLGHKDNQSRRIRAKLFQLFDVEAYFMLDARLLQVGAAWRFSKRYGFKHLSVDFGASLEAAAAVSWHPAHFSGSAGVEGHVELRAFGFGLGLSIGAQVSGEVFAPMRIAGDFRVKINLPWPLPDPSASIHLEWKEPLTTRPPLPLPLREASIEIPARALRWPFQRGTNLLPNYDQGNVEFASGDPVASPEFSFDHSLVVPADSLVGLAFSRPIADNPAVGNHYTTVAAEVVGDPVAGDPYGGGARDGGYTALYELLSVVLEKVAPIAPGDAASTPLPPGQVGVGWVVVAQKGGTVPAGVPELFGAWTQAGPPQLPPEQADRAGATFAQTKLMLNAKSPLEYTARASNTWEDWFSSSSSSYPCLPPEYGQNFVAVFQQELGTELSADNPGHFAFTTPAFAVQWHYGGDVAENSDVVQGILGPIDRGVLITDEAPGAEEPINYLATWVEPPPGATDVLLRFGTPLDFSPSHIGKLGQSSSQPSRPSFMEDAVAIRAYYSEGNLPPPVGGGLSGRFGMSIPVGTIVELTPIVPARAVQLTFFAETEGPSGWVQLFDSGGNPILDPAPAIAPGDQTLRFDADDIASVAIAANTDLILLQVLFRTPVNAVAFSASSPNTEIGRFVEDSEGLVRVQGDDLGTIYLYTPTGGDFTLLELSVPFRTDDIIRHTVEALQQYNSAGPVLEPETDYRLTLSTRRTAAGRNDTTHGVDGTFEFTELAYFRTAPLPGIGVPAAPEGTVTSDPGVPPLTGFEDLSYYVKRTIPVVPPAAGGHRTPGRAAYRAYDPGIEFLEDTPYVELMYRLGRRDLTLRLFDADNQPLRDRAGRVLIGDIVWGRGPTVSATTERWIGVVNSAACLPTPPFDSSGVLGNESLSAPSAELRLAREVLHQARLVPMLLHETFNDAREALVADGVQYRLDRWRGENLVSADPLSWVVRSEDAPLPGGGTVELWYATEQSGFTSSLVYEGALASSAAAAHRDHPSQWKDLRVSVQLRWSAGEVGLELRRGPGGLLRVQLARSGDTIALELLALGGGASTSLGSASTTLPASEDGTLVVECVGTSVQIHLHGVGEPLGEPLIDVDSAPDMAGTIALFASGASDARFSDVQAHDLRATISTAYRWDFISSRYTNFHHHLHSFDDQAFAAPEGAGLSAAQLAAQASFAVVVPGVPAPAPGLGPVTADEARAFQVLEEAALGSAALQAPDRIEVVRASSAPGVFVLLVRSPEPLRWERTQLSVRLSTTPLDLGIPGAFKLTEVVFGATPEEERVVLLVRDAASLLDCRLSWRPLPGGGAPEPAWMTYYELGSEGVLADGTALHVFTGSSSAVPPAPGTEQRFAGDTTLRFPASGIELRLESPSGAVLHQRQFLPASAFAPLELCAIRKPDGTGSFLFTPAGSALPSLPATLRLSFTFARNAGADQPVLRQAGSELAELATLELVLAEGS
jgi:hypothetical protein